MPLPSEYDPLIRELDRRGYVFRLQKGGHYKLFYKGRDRKLVRIENGAPVTMASTPSDHRAYANLVARLRSAGIIEHDPRARTEVQKVTPAFAKARDEHIARRKQELQEAGDLARLAIEPVWQELTAHPQWRNRGWRVLIGNAYTRWLAQEDRQSVFKAGKVTEQVPNAISALLHGNNIEPLRTEEIIAFIEYLDGQPYEQLMQLRRAPAPGSVAKPIAAAEVGVEPEATPEMPALRGLPRERVDFAMEVLAEILGNGDAVRINRALALARRVLDGD